MDTASPPSGDLSLSLPSSQPLVEELLCLAQIPAALFDELWLTSAAETVELSRSEFAGTLIMIGSKHNYGLPSEGEPSETAVATFFRGLRLADLALAHACALGREAAWQRFFTLYRTPLVEAANAITGSATLGHDLADSLHSQLFGLTEREGQRRSPLESYSARLPDGHKMCLRHRRRKLLAGSNAKAPVRDQGYTTNSLCRRSFSAVDLLSRPTHTA